MSDQTQYPVWTPAQDGTLIALHGRATYRVIAAATGRSKGAVAGRIRRLGLPLLDPSKAHPGKAGRKPHRW